MSESMTGPQDGSRTGSDGFEPSGSELLGTEPFGTEAYDPAVPAPLYVPRTPTGDDGVDVLLDRLGDADHLATDGHAEVYEDVHRGLRDTLTALDARPGSPVPLASPGPDNHSNSNRS